MKNEASMQKRFIKTIKKQCYGIVIDLISLKYMLMILNFHIHALISALASTQSTNE